MFNIKTTMPYHRSKFSLCPQSLGTRLVQMGDLQEMCHSFKSSQPSHSVHEMEGDKIDQQKYPLKKVGHRVVIVFHNPLCLQQEWQAWTDLVGMG